MVSIEHAPLHYRCQNHRDSGDVKNTKSKVLRFSPTILSYAANPYFAIGERERHTLWYQPEELHAFKSEARFLCQWLHNTFHQEELSFCRGLEHRMCPQRRTDKVKALTAVLIVQRKLKQERARYFHNYENIIANVSRKYTASARDVALQTGELDALLLSGHAHAALSLGPIKRKIRDDGHDTASGTTALKEDLKERLLVKRAKTRRITGTRRVVTTRAA